MITEQDREFLAYVKQQRQLGFGRMMQIISHEWYVYLKRTEPGMEGGAQIATMCYAFLSEHDLASHQTLIEREKREGMEY